MPAHVLGVALSGIRPEGGLFSSSWISKPGWPVVLDSQDGKGFIRYGDFPACSYAFANLVVIHPHLLASNCCNQTIKKYPEWVKVGFRITPPNIHEVIGSDKDSWKFLSECFTRKQIGSRLGARMIMTPHTAVGFTHTYHLILSLDILGPYCFACCSVHHALHARRYFSNVLVSPL